MSNLQDLINLGGWQDKPKEVEGVMMSLPIPIFEDVYSNLKDTGKGKTILLTDFVHQLGVKNFVQVQEAPDCVSFAASHCLDALKAVEIILNGDFEEFLSITATEFFYGVSRVNVGGGRINGGGTVGAWVAETINTYGSLRRDKYDESDLTKYDPNRAINWGNSGVPKGLFNIAKNTKIKTVSQVRNVLAARDAIANGFPIVVCSNRGFSTTKDKHGILMPSGTWYHGMAILGVDDKYSIPSFLVQNSWPYNWVSGPKRYETEMPGSFWVDYQTIDYMLKQNDSFVYSNFDGYKQQDLDLRIV